MSCYLRKKLTSTVFDSSHCNVLEALCKTISVCNFTNKYSTNFITIDNIFIFEFRAHSHFWVQCTFPSLSSVYIPIYFCEFRFLWLIISHYVIRMRKRTRSLMCSEMNSFLEWFSGEAIKTWTILTLSKYDLQNGRNIFQ